MLRVLIIGATSAIAEATAKRYAARGACFYLIARNLERLEDLSKDLSLRGATTVHYVSVDANAFHDHEARIAQAWTTLNGIDIALIAHGSLGNQRTCEQSFLHTLDELNNNAISVISWLTHIANRMEVQKFGSVAVISSVAGDRGRKSNYIYGTAKAAVSTFLQGLRNRLTRTGVHVLTIKPGFVDTPMTAKFKKGILWSKPEAIAKGIEIAIDKKKDVVYLPGWWRPIMTAIRLIPEHYYKKISL